VDGDSSRAFTVSGLASGIDVFDQIAVIAPPGTGKTTTLLQLAESTLENDASVAVFIPLREWATGSDTFFQLLLKRAAFRDAKERQFKLLAQHGKLVLILDGWNELDEKSKRRMRNEVKALRRDYPDMRLVISSRHKDSEIPIDGPVVEVEQLTEEQQLDIAKTLRASAGESLMDHAWRTPGLRELVAIPLYLTTLLQQASGDSLPTTKEEVLRSFVEEIEQDRDKLATLREFLQGFHREFLEEIGVAATRHETVALSERQARAVVNAVQGRLMAENQIAEPLKPMMVLDTLVSAHMLVRSGTDTGGVSFQHQQFQEWFSSFTVQELMLSAVSGNGDAKKQLAERVLNLPIWEEAILFACDRMSRADQDSVKAVAHAILETLGIDPLLAAEMIWRSSEEVWERIGAEIMFFAGKWHTPGCVDRAAKFMIYTGRHEFSEHVWPLVSDPDVQVHLHALRPGRRFKLSVLGSNVVNRLASLPDEVRRNVMSEIASNCGIDGIEIATLLAKNDTNPEIKESVIVSLLFRRAERYAKDILESAPDEVWRSLARTYQPDEFTDPTVSARMQKEADRLFAEKTDPGTILDTLLRTNVRDPGVGQKVRKLIERIDFSANGQDNRWVIHRAYELYPEDVVAGIMSLLEQGKHVPFRASEMLLFSDVIIDDGPLVDRVLTNSGEGGTAASAASVVGAKTVGQMIDQYFAVHVKIRSDNGRYDKSLRDEHQRLMDLISATKVDVFMQAVLDRSGTDNPNQIHILADLISCHGGSVDHPPLRLDASTHDKVTTAIQRWAEILLSLPEATRAQFAEIAQAAARLESPELVPVLLKLLSEDQVRRRLAHEEFLDAWKKGRQIQNDAHMFWTSHYRDAFSAIGDQQTVDAMKTYLPDLEFGFDAALVLKELWKKSQPKEAEPGLARSWPDFSVVPDAYKKRRSGTEKQTYPLVNDIIAAIEALIKPDADDADLNHALKLASVAFSMPYADKGDTITALLKVPVRAINKRDFLTVLVLSGEVISSQIVLLGIDEFFEDAKTKPWMLHTQEEWRLMEWLMLLPFTERPLAILEVLDRIEGLRREPWNLRQLLAALGNATSAEADTVLGEIAKRDERFLSEYDWLEALAKRNTLSIARAFLDLICNVPFSERRGRVNHFGIGKRLSIFMVCHDQFRKDVYERFSALDEGPVKAALEYAIAASADGEGVLLLPRVAAERGKSLRSTSLYTALEHVLIGNTPVDSSGVRQLYNLPTSDLRKDIFHMVLNGSTAASRIAMECLNTIDEIHDEYGHVDSEPRHPDISMGVPWPIITPSESTSLTHSDV
jgi:hypothetical protein